ncbi:MULTISPECIES: FmdB family zinc ribbon protein [Thermomonospora]|uniref:Regulatory protein, FmdB family n=1 Tax=Thermomonospora curvata (strain ATCC 19995 / DSM 43183 / JCM 3096 / KCTC 9072 / NBRC 15933 / NCIMB 10081 / Henssen B9) TaxID=471852 RepID=D1A9Y7_THECD|nr:MULTISPECIES: zinc ribbon domain-containing protein [Thermomonospora]ACY96923.1 regulatory protein, FmdB family [Thermomonospora curvata DSM 43183]PKK15203.1 MAG: zinc ribbon domain-containing protein [Thermomonospora sp. CIF 1]
MPRYDFRCRTCGSTFEVDRPMSRASEPASCPAGHDDTVKLLSTVAFIGRSTGSARSAPPPAPSGGCCGGGCCG